MSRKMDLQVDETLMNKSYRLMEKYISRKMIIWMNTKFEKRRI